MFHGSMVALVTPFNEEGKPCLTTLASLVEFHIENGTQAIIAAGTTGEAATMRPEERLKAIQTVVEVAKGRIAVIAGTAMAGTLDTIELTQKSMALGADAALIMTPAYIKPTQEGLYAHFSEIAKKNALPIILYNVPGRTACDLLPETAAKLSHYSNIIGIKESSGKVSRTQEIIASCGDKLDIYSGEDDLTFELMKQGAKGVISVAANVVPATMQAFCLAALNHDWEQAHLYHEKLYPLFKGLFWQSNPIPVKWALAYLGKIHNRLRLPLTPLSTDLADKLGRIVDECVANEQKLKG
jgi:4-hydroxy-tetrahydrodipicolinate synthase